jgi:hypothetical protein
MEFKKGVIVVMLGDIVGLPKDVPIETRFGIVQEPSGRPGNWWVNFPPPWGRCPVPKEELIPVVETHPKDVEHLLSDEIVETYCQRIIGGLMEILLLIRDFVPPALKLVKKFEKIEVGK